MATAITPAEQAAWFAAAESAGLSAEDDRDALTAKAENLGIEASWMIPRGVDVRGQEHERYIAYAAVDGVAGKG